MARIIISDFEYKVRERQRNISSQWLWLAVQRSELHQQHDENERRERASITVPRDFLLERHG